MSFTSSNFIPESNPDVVISEEAQFRTSYPSYRQNAIDNAVENCMRHGILVTGYLAKKTEYGDEQIFLIKWKRIP